MLEGNLHIRDAECPQRLYKFLLLQGQDLASRHAVHARPAGQDEDDDHVLQALPDEGNHDDDQHHLREGEEDIRDLQDDGIQPFALVTDVHTQCHADDGSAQRTAQTNNDTDAAAIQHARPDIASHLVRAEDMLGIRTDHPVAQRDLRWSPMGK